MKQTKSTIPLTLRKKLSEDPFYSTCSLYGQHGHQCDGRITWEHAIIVAGKSYQSKWSIIPLCASGHGVDHFQDNHEMRKELNEWVAYMRATEKDILDIFGEKSVSPLGKSQSIFRRINYLRYKYGDYVSKTPPILSNHLPTIIGPDLVKDILALKRIAASMDIHIIAIESIRIPVRINLMGIDCKNYE